MLIHQKLFVLIIQPTRSYRTKLALRHWPKHHASIRAKLVKKIDLPDFQEIKKRESSSVKEKREFMRKEGFPLNPEFNYLPINLTSSGEIVDPFVPPNEDGFASSLSGAKLKSFYDKFVSKGATWRALKKISDVLPDFDRDYFASQARDIYQSAHESFCQWDLEKIRELVTEHCYAKVIPPLERKTLVWSVEKSIEPPRIVHARVGDMLSGKIMIAQVTVRMFSQQRYQIYDRFGRLIAGSKDELQDILEYIVFERMLSNNYSSWRMHDKIVPEWVRDKSHGTPRTFMLEAERPGNEDKHPDKNGIDNKVQMRDEEN